MSLSVVAEEIASAYGKILDLDCTKKDVFNRNFFRDWRKVIIVLEDITELSPLKLM